MKNKYSYLSKNILLFSISSFGQKILAFLLVPLYTSVLSTADYGTVDLITTTVSILVPVFTINISEGVLRFTLKDKDNKDYFSYGIYMTIKAALILLVLLFLLSIIPEEYSFKKYYAWMYLIFIANCILLRRWKDEYLPALPYQGRRGHCLLPAVPEPPVRPRRRAVFSGNGPAHPPRIPAV